MKNLITKLITLTAAALWFVPLGAGAIALSPPVFDYSLNPGDTMLAAVNVFNDAETETTFYAEVVNFSKSEDESGIPQFYPGDENRDGEALASWIDLGEASLTIEPNSMGTLPFSINVPSEDVQPGGHYGAILFSSSPPDSGSTVAVESKLASLILISIAGEVVEAGSIAEFGYENPRKYYDSLPVDFFFRFENAGNTHLRPDGELTISNWYGRKVARLPVNEGGKNVLPNSIRRFTVGWTRGEASPDDPALAREWKQFALGRYKAELGLEIGRDGTRLTQERVFYVWPWRLMLIFSGGFVLLLVLLGFLKRAYDRAAVRKYEMRKKP